MNYILFAVPFFFVLIALELLADRWRGMRNYRLADAISSLATGVLSTTSDLLTKVVGLIAYSVVWQHLALLPLSADSPWVWLGAFVLYDLCYYWLHRFGHERNILWAAHSVHHQSEEYNLTTALRQTSSGFLLSWLFYLPLAIIGIPPLVFFSVAALNLLYQFWVHTRHVPKLGWFEWFFVSPSNHRVHHAQNPIYMDRNYGGVFILWDRLFGTFQEELDEHPVVFGVTTPLASWNPLWANLQFYALLWHDARHTASWGDRLRIWFMRTGWRPADVETRFPRAKAELDEFVKYAVPIGLDRQCYAVWQFLIYLAGGTWLLAAAEQLPVVLLLFGWCWMAYGLYAIGAWLENRTHVLRLEIARMVSHAALLVVVQAHGLVGDPPLAWCLLAGHCMMASIALLVLQRRWVAPVQA